MKHKASWILTIVLVIAGCVLRFAMPGHDFLGYMLWGIAVLVFLLARLHRVGRIVYDEFVRHRLLLGAGIQRIAAGQVIKLYIIACFAAVQ